MSLTLKLPDGRVIEIRGIKPRVVIDAAKVVWFKNRTFVLAKDGTVYSPIGMNYTVEPERIHRYVEHLEGLAALGILKRADVRRIKDGSLEAQKREVVLERVDTVRDNLERLGIPMPKGLDRMLVKAGAQ